MWFTKFLIPASPRTCCKTTLKQKKNIPERKTEFNGEKQKNEMLETQRNKKSEESQEDVEKINTQENKRRRVEEAHWRRRRNQEEKNFKARIRRKEKTADKSGVWELRVNFSHWLVDIVCVSFVFVDWLDQTRVGRSTLMRCRHHLQRRLTAFFPVQSRRYWLKSSAEESFTVSNRNTHSTSVLLYFDRIGGCSSTLQGKIEKSILRRSQLMVRVQSVSKFDSHVQTVTTAVVVLTT